MKIVKFFIMFLLFFLIGGFCLLLPLDYNYYADLNFHLFKPSFNFFQIFNLIYITLFSLSITEVFQICGNVSNKFNIRILLNVISFILIRISFNLHSLLFTFLFSFSLFISLLYVYEEISLVHEKSTRYLDINVLYSLLLSAFNFCLYVLNCS